MEACIIIGNNNKREELSNKIIFINALNEVTRKNGESYLEDAHLDKILSAYASTEDIDGFKRTVSIDEIASNNFDLSLQKYVFINNSFAVESYNMSDCFAKWQTASNDLHVSINQLTDLLK